MFTAFEAYIAAASTITLFISAISVMGAI